MEQEELQNKINDLENIANTLIINFEKSKDNFNNYYNKLLLQIDKLKLELNKTQNVLLK